ncbi:hypothetical protein PV08_07615 [Exophiala spinifera]|uniref:Uncharacterized protein n=1 Tax=Exophiala spinifera TaxID=91928 RepID=A0A0D2B816_9EURO|nr:uncharacterized protein PV08_07615 [Exophiala spinifera]KIW14830.1 hypothetical protein PV08_07615 [Exophiala spinifera]
MMEKFGLHSAASGGQYEPPTAASDSPSPLTWSDTIYSTDSPNSPTTKSQRALPRIATRYRQPWRHSVSRALSEEVASPTVREFNPSRQRWRLFVKAMYRWATTAIMCGLLATCLGVFGNLLKMSVGQVKLFNALIVLLSLFTGNNLASTLREFALMFRWRLLASKYRSLEEFDLIMSCDSLRKVISLFRTARTPGRLFFRLNRTQCLCAVWLGINMCLQVLIALLGVTYNLGTSTHPGLKFGKLSVANLTQINDIWSADNPNIAAQMGSANTYGIQGQDYIFVDGPVPGQTGPWEFGSPSTPTIYGNGVNWTSMTYAFQDENPTNAAITLISHRTITIEATCTALELVDVSDLEAGYSNDTGTETISYVDERGALKFLDLQPGEPGAVTYIGVLNATCGPRCSQVMALQNASAPHIPRPSFYTCNSTLTPVQGVQEYLHAGTEQTELTFQIRDEQARIIAGAIGWSMSGIDYSDPADDDNQLAYEMSRYTQSSWWSPAHPMTAYWVEQRVMEYAIEAVAAMDYNGPQQNVTGWYPVLAQAVTVEWPWAGTILVLVPVLQLVASVCVIVWSNTAIIRDQSALSAARLLRPVVEGLGAKGCLLSGEEIAAMFPGVKVKYGWREPQDLTFRNEIDPASSSVRHVDILQEQEGYSTQGPMPAGFYDGEPSDHEDDDDDDDDDDDEGYNCFNDEKSRHVFKTAAMNEKTASRHEYRPGKARRRTRPRTRRMSI